MLNSRRRTARSLAVRFMPAALAFVFAAAMGYETARAETGPEEETTTAKSTSRLPFMAEEARKRGYNLPLPFGASLVMIGLDNRAIEVTDVRIGIDGNPPRSVNQFIDLGSTSRVFNANLKFDAWLLPFLNVYGILGYVHNTSDTHLHVTVPKPGPIPGNLDFDKNIETELDGPVGGLGMTLAGGIGNFYGVLDTNYVQSDLGFDNKFSALIISARMGYNGKIGTIPLQMWVGFGDWDTASTATGHGNLSTGERFDFAADQRPVTNWMYDIGGNLEFSKRFQLFVDIGADFQGGYFVVIGPTYRF